MYVSLVDNLWEAVSVFEASYPQVRPHHPHGLPPGLYFVLNEDPPCGWPEAEMNFEGTNEPEIQMADGGAYPVRHGLPVLADTGR